MGTQTITLRAGAGAFGDGNHPTTAGVMAALEAIDPAAFTPQSACDMGCGSGILTVAVAQLFSCPVVAADLMESAVRATEENAAANGCAMWVHPVHSDGFNHPEIQKYAPFDLIVMNILAEPLLALAKAAADALAPGGVMIVSGLFQWQEAQIREAYQSLDLELASRLTIGDWVTLVWQKP
jgi:ribosomal protein L11 methyltransferase